MTHYSEYKPIINPDVPFRGLQSLELPDGSIAYTNYKSLQEYRDKENMPNLKAITWQEFDALHANYENSLKTKPAKISKARFWEMLEVLPPCRWHNCGGWEVFHVSERLTGNLVSWFAHRGNQYREFTECASITDDELIALLS